MAVDQRLRKRERLRKRRDYLAVQRRGKRFYAGSCVILWAPGPCAWTRLGITASRKVGGAVSRNRAKRLIREVFRRNKACFPPATDVVVIASRDTPGADYAAVEKALLDWASSRRVRASQQGRVEPK